MKIGFLGSLNRNFYNVTTNRITVENSDWMNERERETEKGNKMFN